MNFKNKKVLVFDLDGTLVDLNVDWIALKKLLSDRYVQIYKGGDCEFKSISGCLDYIVERDDEEELKEFFNLIRKHELKGVPTSKPIKESIFFIQNLQKYGVNPETKLAIFSLNTRACIEAALELANIKEKFTFIVGREDVRSWKPDPEGLLKIRDALDVKVDEMMYIGDMPKDLKAGEKAGIESYYIDEIFKIIKET
ncbi:MAG: HAD family hydrolase [Promethearchaeota archaeon]